MENSGFRIISVATRDLYILDQMPEGLIKGEVTILTSRADVEMLYEKYYSLANPPSLTIIAHAAPTSVLVQMLKFLEGYGGAVTMSAKDPVPETILSRFTRVKCFPKTKDGSMIQLFLKRTPTSLKEKVCTLFGVSRTDIEEETE